MGQPIITYAALATYFLASLTTPLPYISNTTASCIAGTQVNITVAGRGGGGYIPVPPAPHQTDWHFHLSTVSQNKITYKDQEVVLGNLGGKFASKNQADFIPNGRYSYQNQQLNFVVTSDPGYELTWAHAAKCVDMMQKYYVRNPAAAMPGLLVTIADMMALAGACQFGYGGAFAPSTCVGEASENGGRLEEVAKS